MSDLAPPGFAAFEALAPDISAGLRGLGRAMGSPAFDPHLAELVRLRVSQINGCAFCLQHHLIVARQLGVPAIKIDLLAGWRDATVFSPREMVALAWAEHLTAIAAAPVPEHAYAAARAHFSEDEMIRLSGAIATINAWNRLGTGFRFAPPGL
ncbi:MAG: carboxymuconolactone decarboxylase family protein [Rhodospirillales bacterium]|nr:carboxymuconolactone decarboxylase family protein [Rhodospirillales bacterium]